ncbi:MAG: GNAT family N-acetyltransferase [Gemmatimonadota bacterium]|nr:GNAT family N-acetyltransferase [Gemmatimonadota bacterium]
MDTMEEIRPIRESELEELLDLLCAVHNPDGRERYRGYIEGDPTWRPSHTPVVVVDNRIVSTLRIWDRRVHLGATPVRMGGIGGVTTHHDYRQRGIATRLMEHAAEHMRDDGFDLGLLFSAIPARFYLRLRWCCVPLMGFHAELRRLPQPGRSALEVLPFDESRDLEETVALYQRHNAGRSGTMLRPRPYWDYAPSRVRGVLPTNVVRGNAGLCGYINWESDGEGASVYEIAFEGGSALDTLVKCLLDECAENGVTQIYGEIPHGHPFVDALVAAADADLRLGGDNSMMVLPCNLESLIASTIPDGAELARRLPVDLVCRLLFGESSGRDLEPILRARGISLDAEELRRLEASFPRREVIFWAPDHF